MDKPADFVELVYGNNVLMKPLGELLDEDTVLKRLNCSPPLPPKDVADIPKHVRLHMVFTHVKSLFIAPMDAPSLWDSIDLTVRHIYSCRDPASPATWAALAGALPSARGQVIPASAIAEAGLSGTGKTQLLIRVLSLYKFQVYVHEEFPNIIGPHAQVVWQSAQVPASGLLVDLADVLKDAWDQTMKEALGNSYSRFESRSSRPRGEPSMNEWRQVAASHFLGVLHLDDVQNFFKPLSVMERRTRRIRGNDLGPKELAVREEQCVKYILGMATRPQFALALSGTGDGMSALLRLLGNAQRFASSGFHRLERFLSSGDRAFVQFVARLARYQYVAKPLKADASLCEKVYAHTAGVKRIIIAFWISAHRISFRRRKDDVLRLTDFDEAARTFMAPVVPAVQALLSNDPDQMLHYEDLLPSDPAFWASVENLSVAGS